MDTLKAIRVLSGKRRGSSRPVIVETDGGTCVVKLRGAAQGVGPLVAEIIVATLAESIGLLVPARSLVELLATTETLDHEDELADLLAASVGLNLGFAYLAGAHDVTPRDIARVSADDRAAILWLDRFVVNPDRTPRNPNLLWEDGRLWLIDHGAALGFQYDWSAVTEASPRQPGRHGDPHLFAAVVSRDELGQWDELLSGQISRDVLERAVAGVPDTFLVPLVSPLAADVSIADALAQRRSEYVAFLWARLEPPRPFLDVAEPSHAPTRRGPPEWLRR